LFASAALECTEFEEVIALCLTFFIAAIGVFLIVKVSIPWESMKKLLQEEEYSIAEKDKKKKGKIIIGPVSGIYWMLAIAIFIGYGLTIGGEWTFARVFWPVVGILFIPVVIICKIIEERNNK